MIMNRNSSWTKSSTNLLCLNKLPIQYHLINYWLCYSSSNLLSSQSTFISSFSLSPRSLIGLFGFLCTLRFAFWVKKNKSKSALYSLGIVFFLRGFVLVLSKDTPLLGVAILQKLSKINLLGLTSRLSSSIFMSWLTSIISSLSFSTSTDLFALPFLIRNCISFVYKVDTILKKNSLSGSSLSL